MSKIKRNLKYNLGKIFWSTDEKIIKSIQDAEVVSFDIFDTLVKRNVSKPTEVHRLVERTFYKQKGKAIQNYKQCRVSAEKKARRLILKEEVTLDEIFFYLELEEETQKEQLKRIEMDTEISVCCANQRLKKIYEIARDLKKNFI